MLCHTILHYTILYHTIIYCAKYGAILGDRRIYFGKGLLVGRHRVAQVVVVGAAVEARPLPKDGVVDHDAVDLSPII